MHSIYFKEEHEAFRRSVRRFITEEVAPHAEAWEQEGRIPRSLFRRMGELGFLGILHPEAYGGQAAGLFFAVAFLEELPRSLMGGFCASVSVQQFMATAHIAAHGSEELKRRYLAPSIAGTKVGALAITEPDTGSDVASIRTRAKRDGEHFVVNGAKTFITNGAEGDFFTLAVRTGGAEEGAAGISLMAVDADTPGVRVARRLSKLGWHSSDTAELSFEEVRVPAGNLIGEENSGFYQIMEAFPLERLCGAAISIGSSVVALEFTRRYMAERKAFGRPLDRFQALRHRMADLYAELEAARQLTYHAAWLRSEGRPAVLESSMAKLVATELGKKVADECLQFFGGYGFMEEYPAARFYRDARAATIAAGTSEIMREIIVRLALDQGSPEEEAALPARPPRQTAHTETPRPTMASQPAPARPEPSPSAVPAGEVPALPEPPRTVEGLMRSLAARLRPGKTDGWRSLFHYRIEGAASPEWTVRIDGESVSVSEGLEGEPDCRVEMKEATYLGIETGTVNPQSAFMMGKVKVSNLAEMMRFIQAFRPARSR